MDDKQQIHDQGSAETYQRAADDTQVINWDVNTAAIAEVAEELKDIDAYKDLDAAKKAKKRCSKMRTALGEYHTATKAKALAFGRECDSEKNRLLVLIRAIEDPISDQLDDIKNAEAKVEEDRMAAIMGHIERLQAFALDRHSLTLDELKERRETLQAEVLEEDVYEEMLDSAKLSRDEADLKLRLAIDAETTRIEDERKSAEQAEENRQLKEKLAQAEADQAERDAEARKVADEAAAEQKIKDDEAAAAQKVVDDEKQAEFDKVAAEQEAERKALDDEREQREADDAAEAAEEERKNLEAENEARAREQAPDREKLLAYADSVDALLKGKPTLATDTANEVMLQATSMLIEVAYDIRKMTEEMK